MSQGYDIIVIGAGGAGLVAALTAAELSAKVLLISKSPLGLNNCTTYAGGGFTYAGLGSDTAEHRAKTLETGRGINDPNLLDTFSGFGPEAVGKLQKWGVTLVEYERGGTVAPGSPLPGVGGLGMTLPLVAEIKKNDNIDCLENWTVVRLLHDSSHRCTGVLAINLANGKCETIAAKAVIVATGGGGRIYSRSNNPYGTTGDGYHLLGELGCRFRDMEFVQFYPIGLAEKDLPLWFIDLSIIDHAALTDDEGRPFLLEQFKEWGLSSGREGNLYARDRASITILKKWNDGGQAWLHLEQLTEEHWQNRYLSSVLHLNRPSFDFTKNPVRVKPIQHYMSGGIIIDSDGHTDCPGFFACGEVTGGVDGANRIGGNALTNITLFGQRAAEAAVAYAREQEMPVPAAAEFPLLQTWRSNETGASPIALRQELQTMMDKEVAPLRTETGLQQAYGHILALEKQLPDIVLTTGKDLREAIELRSLLTTAKLVTVAALNRTESRGVHYRHDYAEENPDMQYPFMQKIVHEANGDARIIIEKLQS